MSLPNLKDTEASVHWFSNEFPVDFGKPFDEMSVEEVRKCVVWYREHIGGRDYVDAFAGAIAPYLERRTRGLPAVWKHKFEQGEYARKTRAACDALILKESAVRAAQST